ncbi:hypothetical protein PspLS_02458 [Pyricularia sp. CBS 133598]|nr:hypothetical protein PspLS_02458 [Pyricularia sp. CBS 133598]
MMYQFYIEHGILPGVAWRYNLFLCTGVAHSAHNLAPVFPGRNRFHFEHRDASDDDEASPITLREKTPTSAHRKQRDFMLGQTLSMHNSMPHPVGALLVHPGPLDRRLCPIRFPPFRAIVRHPSGLYKISSGIRSSVQRSTPWAVLEAMSASTSYPSDWVAETWMLSAPRKSERARTRPRSPSCAPTTTVRLASVKSSSTTNPSQARSGCAGKRLRARALQACGDADAKASGMDGKVARGFVVGPSLFLLSKEKFGEEAGS